MSRDWAKGSTRRWRKVRRAVLERDGHRCRMMLDGCTFRATHVHHTLGRSTTGDDPAYLVAACQHCNLSTGDPRNNTDPDPRPTTTW